MENKISDFTKISKTRFESVGDREVGREIGQVETVDKEKKTTKKVEPNKVKEEILGLAKSGQSINSFNENVLIKEKDIKGSNRKLKSRNKIVNFLKKLMGGKTADDYHKMKDEEIKRAA